MSLLITLVLSVIMSTDAFLFGLSFGAKKIKLSFIPILLITLTGIFILTISAMAGDIIAQYIIQGKLIGALILIGVGMWLCSDSEDKAKNMLSHPENTDLNKSKKIEPYEAIIIGFVLSIDSATVVLGSALGDISMIILPVSILIFQIVFIIIGISVGYKGIKNVPERLITQLSGFIIVIIGLYRLTSLFY